MASTAAIIELEHKWCLASIWLQSKIKSVMKKDESTNSGKPKEEFPGYPSHPASEDIYSNEKETELDPETLHKKNFIKDHEAPNHKSDMKDMTGDDLDIPGSELDDVQEDIGSEDEENNFYSLGGDDKEAQEEDKTQ